MHSPDFYSQFLSDPNALANGYPLILRHLQHSPANRQYALLNLFHPQIPILTLISNVYASQVFPTLPSDEKQATRAFLMNFLATTVQEGKGKKVESLILFLGKIHNQDGYEEWVGMYGQILQNLGSDSSTWFMVRVLEGADDRVAVLSTRIFKYAIDNYQKLTIPTDQMLHILYLCVRSFAHLNGTDDAVLEQYFTPYADHLIAFIWANFSTSHVAMKYSLKLLTVLFSDFQMTDHESSQANIRELPGVALRVCQEYLQQPGQLEEEEDERLEGAPLLAVVMHQFLELLDTVMGEMDNMDSVPIFYLSLLSATPSLAQWQDWNNNSEEYVLMAEDESEPTLRNRCSQLMVSLLEDHPRKNEHKVLFIKYLAVVSKAVMEGSMAPLEAHLGMALPGSLFLYEEATYYVLNSCIGELFEQEEYHRQLKASLFQRLNQDCQMIVKIACLMICISEPQPQASSQFCQYLVSLSSDEAGMLLIVSRGLGKCCVRNKLQVGSDIPLVLMQRMLGYLERAQSEDSAHIILEFLIKLAEISSTNRQALMQVITPQVQLAMLDRYLHDGMLATMVIDILSRLPHPLTVDSVLSAVLAGSTKDERISELVVKWMKTGHVTLSNTHLIGLLQTYQGPRLSVVACLVKQYLSNHVSSPQMIRADAGLVNLLNQSIDAGWVIYMLRCGILNNPKQILLDNVRAIAYDITSQYELESRMTLPFFMCLSSAQEFCAILTPEGPLFEDFLTKLFRYAQIFKGDHLRIVTSLFFIALADIEPLLKDKTLHLVTSYGKMEVDEWEEEADADDEEAIIERLLGGKMVNEEMEAELKEVFGENAWNSERVKQLVTELGAK